MMKMIMIPKGSALIVGGVFLLCAAWLVLRPVSAEDKPLAKSEPKPALTVSLIKPQSAKWPLVLTANGDITAWQEAVVAAEAAGLPIVRVHVEVGDKVRKGQLLAQLQTEMIAAELAQTQAALREAEAAQSEAEANGDRARKLTSSGALSGQQIKQYLTAEQAANARLAGVKAQLKSAQIRMGQTQILAPDDGTISARNALLGAVVQPGQELFRLIRRDRLEWRAELPSADLARIKVGMLARITTPNKNTLKAKVRAVAPTVEMKTRNGLVYIDLLEQGQALSGMYARGEIELGQSEVLVLPQSAVLIRDGFSYVFRLDETQHVLQTKVTTGQRIGEKVAILSGLDAGTAVVASGVGFLADGDLVRLAPAQ